MKRTFKSNPYLVHLPLEQVSFSASAMMGSIMLRTLFPLADGLLELLTRALLGMVAGGLGPSPPPGSRR